MKKLFLCIVVAVLYSAVVSAGDTDSSKVALAKEMKLMDSVEKAMKYETGTIALPNGLVKLNVPAGFKYLNAEQSNYVITELWGNPPQTGILGMILPASSGPFDQSTYAFILTYDDAGYVKDDDAENIKYDEVLKDIQKDEAEDNKERAAKGYPAINMEGWASKPFYDKTNRVLHWAKNLHVAGSDVNTLNYEVRILGRKGFLSMNAVASMNELDSVKKDIDKVLAIPAFTDGNAYKDFDSKTDNVAAWTIGGLVAGKILLKVGFWGIIVKFLAVAWKFILLGLGAIWAAIKRFMGRKPIVEEDHSVPQ